MPPLDGLDRGGSQVPGLSRADLKGHVTLVNIFASWCQPCREEHPQLEELAKDDRIRLVGINYKDQPENALALPWEFGNPYAAVGVDQKGRTAIDWGVYGVPETFIVGPDGIIQIQVRRPDPRQQPRRHRQAADRQGARRSEGRLTGPVRTGSRR